MKWEKIPVNHRSHQDLVSRIYKEHLQLKDKEATNQLKMGDELEGTFL
jgi:hypothetical protein